MNVVKCWRQWDYETQWVSKKDAAKKSGVIQSWQAVWGVTPPPGAINDRDPLGIGAPRPRTGHSMVLAEYEDSTYILLFGGRDNNKLTTHIPKTYNVKKVQELLSGFDFDVDFSKLC